MIRSKSLRTWSKDYCFRDPFPIIFKASSNTGANAPHLRHKVTGLVQVLGAEGVVPQELDEVVLGDVPLPIVPDPVDHRDAQVLDGPQEVLVSDQVPEGKYVGRFRPNRTFRIFV